LLTWQEEIVPFFQSMQLSQEAASVADCYLEISEKVGPGVEGVK
jgi:hypothetical protein